MSVWFGIVAIMPVQAGDLDSPGGPTDAASQMFTLDAIYNRLDTGAAGAKSGFAEPTTGPTAGTGRTLDAVMGKAPAVHANAAATTEVLSGKTFWGLSAWAWGLRTGSMSNIGAQTITPGTAAQTITQGYHNGSGMVAGDGNLVTGNIRSGVTVFGVSGKTEVVDTTSGDAVTGDLLFGKKAWVGGSEITGNVAAGANVSGGNGLKAFTIPDGLYSGSKTATANDTNLVTGNIRSGVTIFGVAGKTEVVDTTSGDAATTEILAGKRAWVKGVEVTGTRPTAPVPKTGQTPTVPLNPAPTGSDGDLQKGVAWPSPRFTDNGNGTVTDNLTGLVWLKNANAFGSRIWATALTDCATLNTGEAGLSDGSVEGAWRLPNRRELLSLIDDGRYSPALCNAAGTGQWTSGDPFTGVQSSYYWSSTSLADYTGLAWVVHLGYGYVHYDGKTITYYVWPVRSGQ